MHLSIDHFHSCYKASIILSILYHYQIMAIITGQNMLQENTKRHQMGLKNCTFLLSKIPTLGMLHILSHDVYIQINNNLKQKVKHPTGPEIFYYVPTFPHHKSSFEVVVGSAHYPFLVWRFLQNRPTYHISQKIPNMIYTMQQNK
jgi:hypothetical protein